MLDNANDLRVVRIDVDDSITFFDLADDDAVRLAQFQQAVGGYIELVGTLPGRVIYADEEALLKHLPPNRMASAALDKPIYGPVILVSTNLP